MACATCRKGPHIECHGESSMRRYGKPQCTSSAMASHVDKGKKVAISSKGFKRLRKRVATSSSVPRAPLLGGSWNKRLRNMGLNGSMHKRRPNITLRARLIKFLREHGIEEEEADLRLPLVGDLARKLIDVTKVKEPSIVSRLALTQAEQSVMLICNKVGLAIFEPLDDDEPKVLVNTVNDEEEEKEDAIMGAMMVDDTKDADDQDFNPDDDDDA
ncbi:hypothetical protein HAX54_039911 [Datura stramonium]|uniref:Uncharacterized protein n=1 Tax=Datura stramonium TaxID=4076 RepID=A0ABS8VRF4_DATST|nr:hypothetical protein [Datura stramonium]